MSQVSEPGWKKKSGNFETLCLLQPFYCVYVVYLQSTASRVAVQESQIKSPLEKHHADAVVNFLLRIACQVKLSKLDLTIQNNEMRR